MILYFFGFLSGIIAVWLVAQIYLRKYQEMIQEGNNVYDKLEQLCHQCLDVSTQMVSDLEQKIKEAKAVEITSEKPLRSENSPPKPVKGAKRVMKEVKKIDYQPNLSSQHLTILDLKEAGWNIKDISAQVGLGQDQVAMIIQLFHNQTEK